MSHVTSPSESHANAVKCTVVRVQSTVLYCTVHCCATGTGTGTGTLVRSIANYSTGTVLYCSTTVWEHCEFDAQNLWAALGMGVSVSVLDLARLPVGRPDTSVQYHAVTEESILSVESRSWDAATGGRTRAALEWHIKLFD